MSNRRMRTHGERLRAKWAAEKVARRVRLAPGELLGKLGDHALRRDAEGRYRQVALSEGVRPNNMAPSKYVAEKLPPTVNPIRIIQQGIDSLWLNYYGSLRPDVLECLEMAKEDAQAAEAGYALSPFPPFDGTTPLMLGTGLPFYAYRALSSDVQVQVRKPNKRSPRPTAVVRVSSEALWRLGGGGVVAAGLAVEWLRPLFEADDYRVTVSHVHLATDFQGYVPGFADLENAVSRAAGEDYSPGDEAANAAFWDRRKRLTGIASGKSNNLRLNLYDKVRQVQKKGLTWVYDLWARSPSYQADAATWRAEFQYGREMLRKRGIETLDDLLREIPALWGYAMGWFSFRVPSAGDSNKSRWAVAGWWRALSTWGGSDAPELPRVKVVRPRLTRLASGLLGYLTSTMAITGHDSPYDALQAAIDIERAKSGPARLDQRLAAKQLRYAGFTMGAG